MGVYLSAPIVEKVSNDGKYKNFTYGASSMQGWRQSQEDAHSCVPDFDEDKDTSLFAVYDGHGGGEVAQYCALHLPDFIKAVEDYKIGKIDDALVAAFLGFDATLIQDDIIKELKILARMDDDGDPGGNPAFEEPASKNEADMLQAEANMPLEDVIGQYDSDMVQFVKKRKKMHTETNFQSPCLKSKKVETGCVSSTSNDTAADNMNDLGEPCLQLDQKLANGHADNENNLNTEKEKQTSVSERPPNQLPDSSSKKKKVPTATLR